jgi:hypothetical protein
MSGQSHGFCDCRVNLLFDVHHLSGDAEKTNSIITYEIERLRNQQFDRLVVI